MRLKHLLNLKYQEESPIWTYLATYWLAKDINKYGKEYNYLKSNNRTKTLNADSPFYYKDLIEYIKTQNLNIIKKKITTKILYNDILIKGSENDAIEGEIHWKNKLQNLQFSKTWNNIYYTYGPPHTSDLHYRLIHYATETNQYIYNCSRDKKHLSANCNHCNTTEDNLHLFTTCKRIINIWKFYKPTYYKLTNANHTPVQHILTLSSNVKNNKCRKLITTLTQLIIYEIWQSRNNLKYDKIQLSQDTIINKINQQIQSIIKTHYKYHQTNDTLPIF